MPTLASRTQNDCALLLSSESADFSNTIDVHPHRLMLKIMEFDGEICLFGESNVRFACISMNMILCSKHFMIDSSWWRLAQPCVCIAAMASLIFPSRFGNSLFIQTSFPFRLLPQGVHDLTDCGLSSCKAEHELDLGVLALFGLRAYEATSSVWFDAKGSQFWPGRTHSCSLPATSHSTFGSLTDF